MRKIIATGFVLLLGFVGLASALGNNAEVEMKTIVETAVNTDSLSTLVTAVTAADLAETLSGPGPFTVFAPNNAAFAEISESVETLLMPENKGDLVNVLTYHVVPGIYRAADLETMHVETAQGSDIAIEVFDGQVRINDSAHVILADVETSNGIVHVIDQVLLPLLPEVMLEEDPHEIPDEPETHNETTIETTSMMHDTVSVEAKLGSLVEIAQGNRDFTALVDALISQDLVETLEGGEFTVFAPTNAAFNAMPNIFRKALFEDETLLKDVLLAHVVAGTALSSDVLPSANIEAVNGSKLAVGYFMEQPSVENSFIIQADIKAKNGVIHVIDKVLFPSDIRDRIPKIIGREDRF